MKPKTPPRQKQGNFLYQDLLEQLHPKALLLLLAKKIPWEVNVTLHAEVILVALFGLRLTEVMPISMKKVDGDFEAHLVALSRGKPPQGHARWSLRLLGR
jgi:hypothetical protein